VGAKMLLEQKHDFLMNKLNESLKKKHALELKISKLFGELKRLEVTLEKRSRRPTTKEQ
jgi:hypothetical protein